VAIYDTLKRNISGIEIHITLKSKLIISRPRSPRFKILIKIYLQPLVILLRKPNNQGRQSLSTVGEKCAKDNLGGGGFY